MVYAHLTMYAALFFILLLNGANAATWTGSANTQSNALAISISPIGTYVTAGIDTSVTTTSATDKVLLLVNMNMKLGAVSDYGTFTIFRGTTDLSAASKDFHCIRVADAAELQSTSMTFLDIPGSVGTFTYSVRVSGGGTLSFNGQKRQLAALVLPNADFPSARTLVQAKQTFSTTSYVAATGLEAAVTTAHSTNWVLVCVQLNMQPLNSGGGSGAKFTLYRNNVQLGTTPLQIVRSAGQGNNRIATFTFADNPGAVGTYTYSVWAAKEDSTDNSFDINDGSRETAQISTIVVRDQMINNNVASTAVTVTSTAWITCGLSVSSTILLASDKVLVTVNINFSPVTATSSAAFTIFRGTVNLGDATNGLQLLKASNAGESMVASMTFLDSPSFAGQVSYSVQVKAVSGSFVVSEGGQTRQIVAMATQDRTWAPTTAPTSAPTAKPTVSPTFTPTVAPTSTAPTVKPTLAPIANPTKTPIFTPTANPTRKPTAKPTIVPTTQPTTQPSAWPLDCVHYCTLPAATISPGNFLRNVVLSPTFIMEFTLAVPALAASSAVRPSVFSLLDATTGDNYLTLTLTETSAVRVVYQDKVLSSSSVSLVTPLTTSTDFKINVRSNKLYIRSSQSMATVLSYDVNNTIITDNRAFSLYASAPDAVSAGGTISSLNFQGKHRFLLSLLSFLIRASGFTSFIVHIFYCNFCSVNISSHQGAYC